MLQAYIVYILLVGGMTFLARKKLVISNGCRQTHYSLSVFLSILIFSIVIGCRYMVGVDYAGYLSIYESAPNSYQVEGLEFFFKHVINFLAGHQWHYSWFFIISAFLQIYFFYKSFDDDIKYLLPWAVATFLMTEIGSLENGVRHFVALMMFFYSLQYIKARRLLYYLGTIVFASLFHISALFCIPLYWVLGHNIFRNVWLQLILLCLFAIISSYVVSVVENFTSLLILLGYDGYLTMLEEEGSGGIGFYVTWGLNVLIILFFPKLYAAYKDKGFIFTTKRGTPYQLTAINNILKRVQLGGKKISSHIFRHTHISLLTEMGIPLKAIMQRVGHNNPNTTLKIYTHVTEQMKAEISNKLKALQF